MRCGAHANQFLYLGDERICYGCHHQGYDVQQHEPTYQTSTLAVDGLRELREWAGVSREVAARRLRVPVDLLERFEQGWADDHEKEALRQRVARLFLQET
jgi:hypothetical protein